MRPSTEEEGVGKVFYINARLISQRDVKFPTIQDKGEEAGKKSRLSMIKNRMGMSKGKGNEGSQMRNSRRQQQQQQQQRRQQQQEEQEEEEESVESSHRRSWLMLVMLRLSVGVDQGVRRLFLFLQMRKKQQKERKRKRWKRRS